MGLFNIFKSNKDYNIFKEFTIDIKNLDKKDFHVLDEEINSEGSKIIRYSNQYPIKELGFFDTLEFIEFESGERRVVFKAFIHETEINPLIELINRLHKAYGKDMLANTIFEETEIDDIKDMTWTGRLWYDVKPSITLRQTGSEIELAIMSVNI